MSAQWFMKNLKIRLISFFTYIDPENREITKFNKSIPFITIQTDLFA